MKHVKLGGCKGDLCGPKFLVVYFPQIFWLCERHEKSGVVIPGGPEV